MIGWLKATSRVLTALGFIVGVGWFAVVLVQRYFEHADYRDRYAETGLPLVEASARAFHGRCLSLPTDSQGGMTVAMARIPSFG